MKLSHEVAERIASFEQETGCKMPDVSAQIAECTYRLALRVAEVGFCHAQQNYSATQENEIAALLPAHLREDLAKLLYEQYTEGYNAGRAVHSKRPQKRKATPRYVECGGAAV